METVLNSNADIIGAGIGGLTTAIVLKQAGYNVRIFEGANILKPAGAGIILASNAMQIFNHLGLAEKIKEKGNRISAMKITDNFLKPLSTSDLRPFERKYNVTNVAIHRADLQNILLDEIGSDSVFLGKRLKTISEGQQVKLKFEDGTSYESDFLIGADGIRSVVRNQVFRYDHLRDSGQVCWRGVCETDCHDQYSYELNEAWGSGKRFGFVKVNTKKVYWYALINKRAYSNELPLIEMFREFHKDILKLIEMTDKSDILFTEIKDLKPFRNWSSGNICLLGDAAHATTPNLGQGACQAIEDAYVLGICLKRNKDILEALKSYENLRYRKAHKIVNTSWQIGKLAHVSMQPGVLLRNSIMKMIPSALNRKQMEEIFDIGYAK